MRFLFINENLGGHATVHMNVRKALRSFPDVSVDILDVPRASGLRRAVSTRVPGLAGLDADLQPLRAQLATSEWVRSRLSKIWAEYDALHLYTQNTALRSVPLMSRMPTVINSDSTNVLNASRIPNRRPSRLTPQMARIGMRFERPVYRAAARLVVSSQWAADSLIRDYSVPPSHVEVIPFGVDIPVAKTRTDDSNRPRLIFVGASLERKGGNQLLRLHQDRFAARCDLVLITRDNVPNLPSVRVINDLSPGDDRLWDLLTSASIFVFPSAIDQAPNAVLEAMAASLPVIACSVAALPEMVDQGVTGLLVPPNDDQALSDAIELLLDDPDRGVVMGQSGRRRVERDFDMQTQLAKLLSLLAEITRDGPRG